MNIIKKTKQKSDRYVSVEINGKPYRGYTIGEVPTKFGCIEFGNSSGIDSWMKCKGLTYISEDYFNKTLQ